MQIRLALVAGLLVLAGCGQESDTTSSSAPDEQDGSPSATSEAPAFAADQAWVARFEIGGGDEVANGVAYVRFNPTTGATQVTKITGPPLDYEPNPYLLVDAGRTLAVRANAASLREEDNGTMRLYRIDGGKARAVDLRKLTGVATLHPIGWAFDPTQAGLLRVLDRSGRLFEYDVTAGTVTEAEKVAVEKGFELAPMFDSATGMPLLRNKDTWEYQKGGAYTAGGVKVVETDRGSCPAATTLAGTIADPGGTAYGACLVGRTIKLSQQAEGAADWSKLGTSAPDVPRGTMTMTWVLPTVA